MSKISSTYTISHHIINLLSYFIYDPIFGFRQSYSYMAINSKTGDVHKNSNEKKLHVLSSFLNALMIADR